MSARLYGRGLGRGSLAVVTEGFRSALEATGLLDGIVALDKSGGSEEDDEPSGALARDAVFVGPLNRVNVMRAGTRHERHWVMVTPNSTYLPPSILQELLTLPNLHLMSPSPWAGGVVIDTLRTMGFRTAFHQSLTGVDLVSDDTVPKKVSVQVVRHGVDPGFAVSPVDIARARADHDAGLFRVVHFSTTEGQRKGTLELVQAWELLQGNQAYAKAELLLVLDHLAREALLRRLAEKNIKLPSGARVIPRANLSPSQMSKLLGHMHVLAAPSRGEGFGCCPLESRACGVPFVATAITGHGAGHLVGGAGLIVASGDLGPIDDGPGAMAPTVDYHAVAIALDLVRQGWAQLSLDAESGARVVQETWSWQNQLRHLVEQLRA